MKLREVVSNADPSQYALHAPVMANSTPRRPLFRSYLREREYMKQKLVTLRKSPLMAAATRCSTRQFQGANVESECVLDCG